MKISELKAGQGKVDVVVNVKSKEEPRVFNKYGRDLKVANIVVFDESGEMKMSIWNDDIDKVKVNDIVKITNGYVSEFNGERQLTSGKFGKLEVVQKEGEEAGKIGDKKEDVKEENKKGKAKKMEDNEDITDELEEIEEEVM